MMRLYHWWMIIVLLIAPVVVHAGEKNDDEDISTILMRSTFKIQGEKSLGTVFMVHHGEAYF